jgi:hypothetical protein
VRLVGTVAVARRGEEERGPTAGGEGAEKLVRRREERGGARREVNLVMVA